VPDLGLRSHEPLGHGLFLDEEGSCELASLEPGQGPEGEGDLCLDRERRVAAGEQQPQPIVADAALLTEWLLRLGEGHRNPLVLLALGRAPPQAIDGPVPSDGRDPGTRILRNSVTPPPFEGRAEGVLRALLGKVPVVGEADQGRDDPSPFGPEGLGDRRFDAVGYISQIGLTSIVPARAPGTLDAISIASSRSLQSTR